MVKIPITTLHDLVADIIVPFYQVEREVPLRFAANRLENDAEHSWSLALMACALAPHVDPKLDIGKVCQFAVVHDLVEVYAGDTSNFADQAKKDTKEKREKQALKKLQKKLLDLPWITETIEEYESQSSDEARFVKSVDKILPLLFDYLEEGQYFHETKMTAEAWKSHLQLVRKKAATHSGAFEYFEAAWDRMLENPHFFHDGKA
jgi:putative hydrolase of HD superfamily